MGHITKASPVREIDGLREAYAAEADAVARFGDIQQRLVQARAEITLRTRDREMLAGRASRGENITGADLRKAAEAIADAESTVSLLTDALPLTAGEVAKAASRRGSAEHRAKQQCTSHLQRALDDAEAALAAAKQAHARALADMTTMPADTREALDEVMRAHGRNTWTSATAAEIARIRELNMAPGAKAQREAQGRGPFPWPDVGGKVA